MYIDSSQSQCALWNMKELWEDYNDYFFNYICIISWDGFTYSI